MLQKLNASFDAFSAHLVQSGTQLSTKCFLHISESGCWGNRQMMFPGIVPSQNSVAFWKQISECKLNKKGNVFHNFTRIKKWIRDVHLFVHEKARFPFPRFFACC